MKLGQNNYISHLVTIFTKFQEDWTKNEDLSLKANLLTIVFLRLNVSNCILSVRPKDNMFYPQKTNKIIKKFRNLVYSNIGDCCLFDRGSMCTPDPHDGDCLCYIDGKGYENEVALDFAWGHSIKIWSDLYFIKLIK